jgi:hypothetical protein
MSGRLLAMCLGVAALSGATLPGSAVAEDQTEITSFSADVSTLQAGAHPDATVSFRLATTAAPAAQGEFGLQIVKGGAPKDLTIDLPRGILGNPQAAPACPLLALSSASCPVAAQVGHTTVHLIVGGTPDGAGVAEVPVYNMIPERGEVAKLGFRVFGIENVFVSVKLRTNGDYGVTTTVGNIFDARPLWGSDLTLWGVPADPIHNAQRSCFQAPEILGCSAAIPPVPFMTNPAECGVPGVTTMKVDTWQHPGQWVSATSAPQQMTGCAAEAFNPFFGAQPDTSKAGTPTGLNVDIKVPQTYDNPTGLATPPLRDATVALPQGMSISPSAADGLLGCTDTELGIGTELPAACPDASKIGTATLTTPLLADTFTGSVYLGSQQSDDPVSGQMYRLFLDLQDKERGIEIKLPGQVTADPVTGQLTATFKDNPQLPFSELKLNFKGGPRAPLSTPSACGTYTTISTLTSWGGQTSNLSDSFTINQGCPTGSFAPAFAAGTASPQAGAFSPFALTFSRSDQDQDLGGIRVQMPPGLLGKLAGIPLCGEAQANAGTCPTATQIGHTTVGAGPGSNPLYLPVAGQPANPVYLTAGYKGAPYGLSVVVPAIAGPFNLGTVVVRAAINIDPHTAQITVTSDPLPTILKGVPLQLRTVNVTIDRPGFMFNPTNCSPLSVGGTITSTQGANAAVSSRFQAANCATLPFKPKFTVLTQAKTSKANGASLHVKVTSGPGQANIGKVKVDLPKQLPSRLTTLQKACPDATFNANPASCPAASIVGEGTAVTPILNNALRGPTYLVSHAGAAFPDLVIVLQGEGITLDLVGNTDIKKGITISTFNTVPDAPISTFDLVLPQGPHSALAAYGNLCKTHLNMPTALTGQNGAQVEQTTRIAVSGCPKARKHSKAKHGRKHKKK